MPGLPHGNQSVSPFNLSMAAKGAERKGESGVASWSWGSGAARLPRRASPTPSDALMIETETLAFVHHVVCSIVLCIFAPLIFLGGFHDWF